LAWLLDVGVDGVLCLEVFGEVDFAGSLDAVQASLARIRAATATGGQTHPKEG
jgi:hypothetical protein